MLVLKCLLVPLLILLSTLALRRWGAKIGGLIAGLPFIGMAIMYVLATEVGPSFAATAAVSGISGLAAYIAYGAAYAWAARRFGWLLAYLLAAAAWAASAGTLVALPLSLPGRVAIAIASLAVAPWILPPQADLERRSAPARDNLPLRMAAGAALAIFVSLIGKAVGGVWAGLFAAFPVLGSITLIAAHRSGGAEEAARLFRGMASGAWSAVVAFSLMGVLLPRLPLAPAFLISGLASMCAPAAYLLFARRAAAPASVAKPA